MPAIKDKDRITGNDAFFVDGIVQGRDYVIGMFYESGTGTGTIGQKLSDASTVNDFYEDDGTTVLTVTATTPKFHVVKAAGDQLYFETSSTSSLVGIFRCFPVPHGY